MPMRIPLLAFFFFLSAFAQSQTDITKFAELHTDAVGRYRAAVIEGHAEDVKALDSLANTYDPLEIDLTREDALRGFYNLMLYTDWIKWPYDPEDYEIYLGRKKKLSRVITPQQSRIFSNCKPLLEMLGADLLSFSYPFEVAPADDFDVRFLEFIQPEKNEVVAEVGAGNGYYGLLLAAAYPEVLFVLNEIYEPYVTYMNQKVDFFPSVYGTNRVAAIMGDKRKTNMNPGSVDHLLVANTYHHFKKEKDMLASIRETLKKNGSFYVIEPNFHVKRERTAIECRKVLPRDEVVDQITGAGFQLVEEQTLEEWYFLRFEVKR